MWSIRRYYGTFRHSDLVTTMASSLKEKPVLDNTIPFGKFTTDHMLVVKWKKEEGWLAPEIKPVQNFELDPSCAVFQYGNCCFEGMKAYRSTKDDVLLFRPDMNAARLNRSVAEVALPTFDEQEFINCLADLIKVEESWVPAEKGFSLYIRPTVIATHNSLGVETPEEATLFVINTIVGPYYPSGFKPVSLYADTKAIRAWPGGTGDVKIGGNYSPSIMHGENAKLKGHDQVLWLFNREVTEVGTMNLFVFWKNEAGEDELVTAPLDGTILPGVTRDSLLTLAREWGEFQVTERTFTIDELCKAVDEGRVYESFGAGTAAVVAPVKNINFDGNNYAIPVEVEGNTGPLALRFWNELLSIQYGDFEHKWQKIVGRS